MNFDRAIMGGQINRLAAAIGTKGTMAWDDRFQKELGVTRRFSLVFRYGSDDGTLVTANSWGIGRRGYRSLVTMEEEYQSFFGDAVIGRRLLMAVDETSQGFALDWHLAQGKREVTSSGAMEKLLTEINRRLSIKAY